MTALLLLCGASLSYFLATLSYRYCAKGHMPHTTIMDMVVAANGYVVIKLVANATSLLDIVWYVIGAGFGSWAAMWWTKGLASGE